MNMKMKLVLGSLVMVVGAGYGAAVMAQAKPETLLKQRQAGMTLIGKYWGPIAGMPSGKAPYNAERVTTNARRRCASLAEVPLGLLR